MRKARWGRIHVGPLVRRGGEHAGRDETLSK